MPRRASRTRALPLPLLLLSLLLAAACSSAAPTRASPGSPPASRQDATPTPDPSVTDDLKDNLDRTNKALDRYSTVIFAVLIPIGLLLAFFGYYLLKPSLFVAGALVGGFFAYSLTYSLTKESSAGVWAPIVATVLFGLLTGAIAAALVALGIFALGAALGVTIAFAVRGVVLAYAAYPLTTFYVTAAVLGVVFGVLALLVRKVMIVVATAYGGSFAAVYAVGYFTGHFPDVREISDKDDLLSSKLIWVFFAAWIVAGTVGLLVQFAMTSKWRKDEPATQQRKTRRGVVPESLD